MPTKPGRFAARYSICTATIFGLLLLPAGPVSAVMYCHGMGVIAELTAKMRDSGMREKQTLTKLRMISPTKTVNQDVADLVNVAYMKPGRAMSPAEFRAFFESYCRNNGFDRPL